MKFKVLLPLFLLQAFFWSTSSINAQLYINELSCTNENTTADNYGEYEDWFEIYNAGGSAVDITGYYLSDKLSEPTKWLIPSGSIPAGGYQVFYASNRDIVVAGNYHTNFKLTQTKQEYIVLSDPSGTVLDAYWIENPMKLGDSRGRVTDGAASWGVFNIPTPGSANIVAQQEYATKPAFSMDAGFYTSAINVAISSPDADVTIYYTTDGTVPTTTSTLYTGPISINNTTTIRARAFSSVPDVPVSFTETNTYFINETHTLPVISVASAEYDDLFNFFWVNEIRTSFEYFNADGSFEQELEGDMKGHGNDSWAFAQKGIRFYARDKYGYDHEIDHQVFPEKERDSFDVLILRNAGSDNYPGAAFAGRPSCHLRDGFAQTLSVEADMALDQRSYESCIVYINGEYWGIYEMRERIDSDFTEEYYNQPEEDVDMLEFWGGLEVRYGSAVGWNDLYDYMMANDLTVQANYDYVATQLDINSFIDYFIINTYLVNTDWLNWNTKWWRGNADPVVRFKYTLWDMDNVINLGENYTGLPGTGYEVDPCAVEDLFTGNPNVPHVDMFNALFENEDFFSLYLNRYLDLLNTTFHKDFMIPHLEDMAADLEPEMPAQVARWGGSMAEWEDHIDEMKDFLENRYDLIIELIQDCNPDEITGVYTLTADVDDPNGGDIRVNTVIPETYPWTGNYFGGVELTLTAIPQEGWVFDRWEITGGGALSSATDEISNLNLTGDASVKAFFIKERQVTFLVDPPLSGEISIDGAIPGGFPFTQTFLDGTNVDLSAVIDERFEMVNWTSLYHTLTPFTTDNDVSFTVTADNDSITLNLAKIILPFTVTVEPENSGTIDINGVVPVVFPYETEFEHSTPINIEATPNNKYVFEYWTTENHSLNPNEFSQAVGFNIKEEENMVAHFRKLHDLTILVSPEGAGSVRVDERVYDEFPVEQEVLDETTIYLAAYPEPEYEFVRWTLENHFVDPKSTSQDASLTVEESDVLVANYKLKDVEIFVPESFTPNNDGVNDIFTPVMNADNISDYEMRIFDRWGELVFETNTPGVGWNGEDSSNDIKTGVYVYQLTAHSLISGKKIDLSGSITLFK